MSQPEFSLYKIYRVVISSFGLTLFICCSNTVYYYYCYYCRLWFVRHFESIVRASMDWFSLTGDSKKKTPLTDPKSVVLADITRKVSF